MMSNRTSRCHASPPWRPRAHAAGTMVAMAVPQVSALSPEHPWNTHSTAESPLVRAYRGEPVGNRRPVWFMRQAGRSLPEYRAAREGTAMLESCLTPELASEITLQPVRRHDVDAAILYSDIVVPLRVAGVDVDIAPGVGPVVGRPVRDRSDLNALLRAVP